jgi:hypothetical protein
VSLSPAFFISIGLGLVILAVFGILIRSVLVTRRNSGDAITALCEVRLERYRPLARLLSVDDVEYLRGELAVSPQAVRRLIQGRRKIALEYLRALEGDFHVLYAAATDMLVFAPESDSDLASRLAELRFRFQLNLLATRVGLFVPTGAKIEVERLIGAMQTLQSEVGRLNDLGIERQLA